MSSRRLLPAGLMAVIGLAVLAAAPVSRAEGKRLTLASADFANGESIPPQFTCDGPGTSPELSWSNAPPGTQSLALVVRDPDAPGGNFVHWIVYDIPGNAAEIQRDAGPKSALPSGALEGTNGHGSKGWTPPCPQQGTHHYHFELDALDTKLAPMTTPTGPALFGAMRGHVLDRAELVATYQRSH